MIIICFSIKIKHKDDSVTEYQNERVIVNSNGVENPMIPVAAGIGGEVIVACSDCRKMIGAFIKVFCFYSTCLGRKGIYDYCFFGKHFHRQIGRWKKHLIGCKR